MHMRSAMAIRAVLLLCLTVVGAQAATVTWALTTGGAWETAANWIGGAVPGVNDDAVIPNTVPTGQTITVSAATVSLKSLTLGKNTLTFTTTVTSATIGTLSHAETAGTMTMQGATSVFSINTVRLEGSSLGWSVLTGATVNVGSFYFNGVGYAHILGIPTRFRQSSPAIIFGCPHVVR
eukprot:TRINITY_DN3520_c0_g1_i2.p2 TRINITY_DN3520_c0_g1~~TRINITY_DN3520_c0_g1_i2.p2  ORF type:complete len:179 (-),score=58.33 TRINITY_DN3520_c0_g1_i2:3086-3622(-)